MIDLIDWLEHHNGWTQNHNKIKKACIANILLIRNSNSKLSVLNIKILYQSIWCCNQQLLSLLINLPIIFSINGFVSSIKCLKILKKAFFKVTSSNYLFIPKKQSKTPRYSIYNYIKQRKVAIPHIREGGTKECLIFLHKNDF